MGIAIAMGRIALFGITLLALLVEFSTLFQGR